VLGIDTDAPGFRRVRIEPHLGTLKTAGGEIPHPLGKISVKYTFRDGKWNVLVNLPVNLTGTFIWEGKRYELKAGETSLTI
jgi:alpha-L-rhamnosidase